MVDGQYYKKKLEQLKLSLITKTAIADQFTPKTQGAVLNVEITVTK